jgi:GAF domain-containing protein
MAEELTHVEGTKEEIYQGLLPQIKALVNGESDATANLANVCAALKQTFGFFWVGFYLVKGNELVLGPFQGPIACTRIAFGKGVCGKAWETKATICVEDVTQFPGHIACSAATKSEVVIPIQKNNTVIGVLDVDSTVLSDFDAIDVNYLNELCTWLSGKL